MSRFLSVETPGGPIWVEVSDTEDTESVELVANRKDIYRTFEESAQAMKQNAQYLVDLMSGLGPTEVEVTFGMSVGVEASIPVFALAQVNGAASYTVTLKWQSGDRTKGRSEAESDVDKE